MPGAICRSCGGYLDGFDTHDEKACAEDKRRETYRLGAAKAKAAYREAMATVRYDTEETE